MNLDISSDRSLIHARLPMRAGLLTLRDANPQDADPFVEYWTDSPKSYLKVLGVDTARLGDAQQIRERFMRNIPSSEPLEQPTVIYSIYLKEILIGYTNINRYDAQENYMHLHIYRKALRKALVQGPKAQTTGGGVGACTLGLIIAHYLKNFDMERLVMQTRTRNMLINRALDLYLPASRTCYFENPDGLSAPGEFHVRYAYRGQHHFYQERAQVLARQKN
ncbi:N-acetyltransferase [Xanthomonas oryzae]|uniref:N-acetyltransferase n=1 Tax=Xanthomonas oryzae TaxID=347 RepID=UPI00094A1585|nr:N-acetyltransferase [Xanthomonas oryzae]RBH90108.1 N-acetyltransferase [Xanthomonas oryzae pv. oryzae]RBL07265.1 N-acetyltransferase [Xanthomonas oryzae pv. oryzae]RBL22492.1 N-acetyltransferase [Xanthomonas oryzae pv. oryzae]RBL59209.1 N-acetyltransferase [Xanthomonas oryzae pv. oryzae]UWU54404.1 N-acetyltransferase [Xanthomonas oryzae pv. oryzae]